MRRDGEAEGSSPRVFLGQLEGLRAIALGVVVGFHATSAFAPGISLETLTFILQIAFQGLIVFFVMSGALLSTWFLQRTATEPLSRGMVADYARLRAARILPGYWVAFGMVALISLSAIDRDLLLPDVNSGNLWIYLALLQDYFDSTRFGGLIVVWSLTIEVTFYAALPLLFAGGWFAASRGLAPADLVFAVISFVLGAISLTAAMIDPAAPPTVANLYWHIALGSILAVARMRLIAGDGTGSVLGGRAASLMWLGAIGVFCAAFIPDVSPRIEQLTYGVVGVLFMAASMLSGPGWPGAWVTLSRPARWVGEHSYGIFLWHIPILSAVGLHFDVAPLPGIPLALTLTAVVALLSYRLVERPAMNWARRATGTQKPVEIGAAGGSMGRVRRPGELLGD